MCVENSSNCMLTAWSGSAGTLVVIDGVPLVGDDILVTVVVAVIDQTYDPSHFSCNLAIFLKSLLDNII